MLVIDILCLYILPKQYTKLRDTFRWHDRTRSTTGTPTHQGSGLPMVRPSTPRLYIYTALTMEGIQENLYLFDHRRISSSTHHTDGVASMPPPSLGLSLPLLVLMYSVFIVRIDDYNKIVLLPSLPFPSTPEHLNIMTSSHHQSIVCLVSLFGGCGLVFIGMIYLK